MGERDIRSREDMGQLISYDKNKSNYWKINGSKSIKLELAPVF